MKNMSRKVANKLNENFANARINKLFEIARERKNEEKEKKMSLITSIIDIKEFSPELYDQLIETIFTPLMRKEGVKDETLIKMYDKIAELKSKSDNDEVKDICRELQNEISNL